jgi:hypothetical protein
MMAIPMPTPFNKTLLESALLDEQDSPVVGAVVSLDFHRAVVLTHDFWKRRAGGIPQFTFLLAASSQTQLDPMDDEVLLLRVEGTAPLAMDHELTAAWQDALKQTWSDSSDTEPATLLDEILDPFTKNRMSFTGLNCDVLGTFYEELIDGESQLQFGTDVDNFYSTTTYRVLKPQGRVLSNIASYLRPTPAPRQIARIGRVRYSSTERRTQVSGAQESEVQVDVTDFVGHKTGMFGMTRMGKSNTMKTIIARTQALSQQRARAGGSPIGQLILDPQGEYANPNQQDGTEIAAIGPEHVSIYKYRPSENEPGVLPLSVNFFDPEQVQTVKFLVDRQLSEAAKSADYVGDFISADFTGRHHSEDDDLDVNRKVVQAERGRLMLYGALARADFPVPKRVSPTSSERWAAWVTMDRPLAEVVESKIGSSLLSADADHRFGVQGSQLIQVCDFFKEGAKSFPAGVKGDERLERSYTKFIEGSPIRGALPIFTQRKFNTNTTVSGYSKLRPLAHFHDSRVEQEFRTQIYSSLEEGKIVIVDLHLGPLEVVQTLSEMIADYVRVRQTETFTNNEDPPSIQLVLEEAHNLFSHKRYQNTQDVWVKLAKEASKLNIGLIYATQEVSGVAHEVLANTKNWVVAHLNNSAELRALGSFYDFSSFSDAILASEDRGYVRLKTMSSPYIVPAQIDRYDYELVNEARAAAGMPALQPPTR